MKRKAFAALLCCLCAATLPFAQPRARARQKRRAAQQPPAAQAQDEVETVNTTLVTVPVRVSDRAGRFMTDLRREQFHVFEDGVEQQVSFFETAEQPFTVALMLDMSDSARLKREEIRAAARAFVAQLHERDRVLVASFDKNLLLLSNATSDRQALLAAIDRTATGGGTSIYDAVQEIVGRRLRAVPGRKAVIILSDGIDTTSRASQAAAVSAADESDALVYAVQFEPAMDKTAVPSLAGGGDTTAPATVSGEVSYTAVYRRAAIFLETLANRTGGRYYMADSIGRLSESFARIAEELRQQYSLGYYPVRRDGEGKRRKLKVTVDAPGAVVHARSAYVFKPRRVSRRDDLGRAVATIKMD